VSDSDPSPVSDTVTRSPERTDERGAVIGVYQLLQQVGEGGMGEVWLAEQTRPLRRQVALKIIKAGMDSAHVIARFEAERQALAMMDHPAVAKVLDAGTTPLGRPFFAMEYVKGEAITTYCDRCRLSTRQRLELFIRVCEGVQNAHYKGIIHRDLKPSNVLVTIQDDRPQPKIIDFGIAKATTGHLGERTLFTELGVLVGTPEYMSPEQAELTALDIDTRTDVYSLGVLLYELLTGVLPFEAKALREKPLHEIQRTLREVDAPLPSTRVSRLGPSSAAFAKNRDTDPARLVGELRGDLDWITMRAMEKDRTRRYATASELAADLRRHLDLHPVLARPTGALYRSRKFARRHRFGVGTAATLALLLSAFATMMAIQARRIATERDRANQEAAIAKAVNDFLENDLLAQASAFTQARPGTTPDPDLKVRTALDRAGVRIEGKFATQPLVEASIQETIGRTYMELGLYAEAQRHTERALMLRRQELGDDNVDTLDVLADMSWLAVQLGHYDEAERWSSRDAEREQALFGPDHTRTLRARTRLGLIYTRQGRLAEAASVLFNVAAAQKRTLGADHADTLATLNNLALLYYRQKRFAEAITLDEEILSRRQRLLGDEHPLTLTTMNNLAYHYQAVGRYEDARRLLNRAIAVGQKVFGEKHATYGTYVNSLGELDLRMGNLIAAEVNLSRALEIYKMQPDHRFLPLVLYELAQVSALEGKSQQALSFLSEAVTRGYRPDSSGSGLEDPSFVSLGDC